MRSSHAYRGPSPSAPELHEKCCSGRIESAHAEYDVNMTNLEPPVPLWRDWAISEVAFGGRRLDRPGPAGVYRIPARVAVSQARIEYWYMDPDEPLGVVSNAAGGSSSPRGGRATRSGFAQASGQHLREFIDPRLKTDRAFVEFARRWGVLEICQHGLPRRHSAGLSTLCRPLGHESIEDGGWEPMAAWRFFQRQAIVVLSVSDRLRRNERIDRETWQDLFDEDGPRLAFDRALDFSDPVVSPHTSQPLDLRTGRPAERPPVLSWVLEEDDWDRAVWECDLGVQRWCAGLVMQSWLEVGRPEMFVDWSGRGASVWVGARSLFGVLAMQLAFAASGSLGFAICHECRALFLPTRRAKAGQRTYCAECRENQVPLRDAARDYRERKGAKPRSDR
jgi:hypothetical protein